MASVSVSAPSSETAHLSTQEWLAEWLGRVGMSRQAGGAWVCERCGCVLFAGRETSDTSSVGEHDRGSDLQLSTNRDARSFRVLLEGYEYPPLGCRRPAVVRWEPEEGSGCWCHALPAVVPAGADIVTWVDVWGRNGSWSCAGAVDTDTRTGWGCFARGCFQPAMVFVNAPSGWGVKRDRVNGWWCAGHAGLPAGIVESTRWEVFQPEVLVAARAGAEVFFALQE